MTFPRTGHISVNAIGWNVRDKTDIQKDIATEVPVALVYNGVSHAVMMVTPLDLEDFALGFSISEGIIESPAQLLSLEIRAEDKGFILAMKISEERFSCMLHRKRNLTGVTGCSLCGIESLEEAVRPLPPVRGDAHIPFQSIYKAYENIHQCQPEKVSTGAVHGAAFADTTGNIIVMREDVGRHNALDKMIGAAIKQDLDPQNGFIMITSRCSFEMVQKTVAYGASVLAAISAPTELAVKLASDNNLTLVSLARKEQFIVFTHARRIINQ